MKLRLPKASELDHPLPFLVFTSLGVIAVIGLLTIAAKAAGLPGPVSLLEH